MVSIIRRMSCRRRENFVFCGVTMMCICAIIITFVP